MHCLEATEADSADRANRLVGNAQAREHADEEPFMWVSGRPGLPRADSPLSHLRSPTTEPAPLPPPIEDPQLPNLPPPSHALEQKPRRLSQAKDEAKYRTPPPKAPAAISASSSSRVGPLASSSPQPPQVLECVKPPSRQQQSASSKQKGKHELVHITDFLNSHKYLLDHLAHIRDKQADLRHMMEDLEQKKDQEMTDLLEALKYLADTLHRAENKKEIISKQAQHDALAKAEDAKLDHDILEQVKPHKEDKLNMLTEIDAYMEALSSGYGKKFGKSWGKTKHDSQYSSIPDVEVTVLVKGVTSVDTAAMLFEVNVDLYLVWGDPLIYETYWSNSGDENCKDLHSYDWEQFFNPSIYIENNKGLIMRSQEVPSFCKKDPKTGGPEYDTDDDGRKHARMSKKLYMRGKVGLNSVDLSCFPFDMQILPLSIRSERTGVPNKNNVKRVRLVHPRVGAKVGHSDSTLNLCLGSKSRKSKHQWGKTVPYNVVVDKKFLLQSGHCVLPEIEHQLIEFNFLGIRGSMGASCLGAEDDELDRKEQQPQGFMKEDTYYEVNILVERPFFSNYFWEIIILTMLVFMAAFSFWDTAAPELSSRMSITLVIILTLAAYTGDRPPQIEKTPSLTFQDRYELCGFFLVVSVSILNVISVTVCGGEHEEAPDYMLRLHQPEACKMGWCHSRLIDCTFFLFFTIALVLIVFIMYTWVRRSRRTSTSFLRKLTTAVFVDAQREYIQKKLRSTSKELHEMDNSKKLRQFRQHAIYLVLGLATVSCGLSLEGTLRSATHDLRAMSHEGWIYFGLAFVATSLHFTLGHFVLLMAAGYTFGLAGLIVGQIGTFVSACFGYWLSQMYSERVLNGVESFPAAIRLFLEAVLIGGEFNGARGFINICALRNNINVSFGWVNAIVAIGHADFFLFILATMVSIQPQIVLWVTLGRAMRAVAEEVHPGSQERVEPFNDGNLSGIYLTVAGSFLLRLGAGCWGRFILTHLASSHREPCSEPEIDNKKEEDVGQGTGLH